VIGDGLLEWLLARPPHERDQAIEGYLGFPSGSELSRPPGEHLIGYHASAVSTIVRLLIEVPVTSEDHFVDLGSGLGKAVLLAHLLTGCRSRGVELQAALCEKARASAARLGIAAKTSFDHEDARSADLASGTVFFLYSPFDGPVLDLVLERLRAVASRRAIAVAAHGLDLTRRAAWLLPRPTDAFWLTIYDSQVQGVASRLPRRSELSRRVARAVALELASSADESGF
jgi:SAM-dependent methyltransferase